MPMLSAQLDLIREMGMEAISVEEKFVYQSSKIRPARISSISFRNDKFRKVRLTYFDGGSAVQVFNTLWYPSYEYDAPLLGVDLISLGTSRVLSVIDMQPLHPTEEYSSKYIDHMAPVRNKYPDLHGVLSGKIYDDTSFFSKQMLFGRFTDESKVAPVVLPAFKEYLSSYVGMVSGMTAGEHLLHV
jgi:15,16-dihydrobiliverdin:ferredoxin oxidoreductase